MEALVEKNKVSIKKDKTKFKKFKKGLYEGRHVYVILSPVILYYLIFHYAPLYGILLAFKDYKPFIGIWGSPWVGFKNFTEFFESYYFVRLITNTLALSIGNVIFSFPAPIILALLLNEVRNRTFKRITQTISYLPHFVSTVVLIGILVEFLSTNGMFNTVIKMMGGEPLAFLGKPEYFRSIFITFHIWESVGWGAIVYLAALSGIDPELYEAAMIDGANRWQQTLTITLPCLAPTIIILLILQMGRIMNVGFEKVLLMQNNLNMETSDIISTFVYRRGILEGNFSFTTAISLFNNVINFILLVASNKISRKVTESSLW